MKYAVATLCALLAWSCGPTCNKNAVPGEEVDYTAGHVRENGTFYETSDWCGPWLHIPSGRTYRLAHGLNVAPLNVEVTVTFDAQPFGEDCKATGFTAASAGNIVIGEQFNDQYIQVRNDTCEPEYYFRLTATFPGATDEDAGSP